MGPASCFLRTRRGLKKAAGRLTTGKEHAGISPRERGICYETAVFGGEQPQTGEARAF